MNRVYSPSTEALIAQLEDRMAQGRRFGVPAAPGSSAQDVRRWVDEGDPETIEHLKGLIQYFDHSIAWRRKDYQERRRSVVSCVAAIAILASFTALWIALPNRLTEREPLLASVWLASHVVAPFVLVILFAVPYSRRGITTGSFGIVLLIIFSMWSLGSLFLAPLWWPTALGGREVGYLITFVGFGILILAVVGGWAYQTWHNPREGLVIAALAMTAIAVMVTAQWLEERYGINWWLTVAPAFGAFFLFSAIIERRRKKRAESPNRTSY